MKSENYISVINEGLSNSQKHSHLDPSLTDLEKQKLDEYSQSN